MPKRERKEREREERLQVMRAAAASVSVLSSSGEQGGAAGSSATESVANSSAEQGDTAGPSAEPPRLTIGEVRQKIDQIKRDCRHLDELCSRELGAVISVLNEICDSNPRELNPKANLETFNFEPPAGSSSPLIDEFITCMNALQVSSKVLVSTSAFEIKKSVSFELIKVLMPFYRLMNLDKRRDQTDSKENLQEALCVIQLSKIIFDQYLNFCSNSSVLTEEMCVKMSYLLDLDLFVHVPRLIGEWDNDELQSKLDRLASCYLDASMDFADILSEVERNQKAIEYLDDCDYVVNLVTYKLRALKEGSGRYNIRGKHKDPAPQWLRERKTRLERLRGKLESRTADVELEVVEDEEEEEELVEVEEEEEDLDYEDREQVVDVGRYPIRNKRSFNEELPRDRKASRQLDVSAICEGLRLIKDKKLEGESAELLEEIVCILSSKTRFNPGATPRELEPLVKRLSATLSEPSKRQTFEEICGFVGQVHGRLGPNSKRVLEMKPGVGSTEDGPSQAENSLEGASHEGLEQERDEPKSEESASKKQRLGVEIEGASSSSVHPTEKATVISPGPSSSATASTCMSLFSQPSPSGGGSGASLDPNCEGCKREFRALVRLFRNTPNIRTDTAVKKAASFAAWELDQLSNVSEALGTMASHVSSLHKLIEPLKEKSLSIQDLADDLMDLQLSLRLCRDSFLQPAMSPL